jgi:retron-type reverse transcriptase
MDLATLLYELKPLLAEPLTNLAQITRLLEAHRDLAEHEVARFYVAGHLRTQVERAVRSVDPRERRLGLRTVAATFPRATAAKIVRHLVKDPDGVVRSAAQNARLKLGLWHEVALRDSRYNVPRYLGPLSPGAWNPSGWAFGLRRPRAPKKPPTPVPARPIANAKALCTLLGVESEEALVRFSRPGTGSGSPYVAFEIPKHGGGTRTIHAPRAALKAIQRTILKEILAPLALHPACHGFVAGRSTVTNARPHLKAAVVLKTDLRDFFPSVHYRRVLGFFETHCGYHAPVASLLARLTTHRAKLADGRVAWPGVLPQGAPTSPALANLICRRLDERLSGLARRVGAVYTRYADDLTFSFPSPPEVRLGRFFWWVDQICQQEGFAEHNGKRRIMRPKGQQRVTGLVVNETLSVPRAARRRFRAILANCRRHGIASQARGREDFADYLRGFAAYVAMVQPELGRKLVDEVRALLGPGSEG